MMSLIECWSWMNAMIRICALHLPISAVQVAAAYYSSATYKKATDHPILQAIDHPILA